MHDFEKELRRLLLDGKKLIDGCGLEWQVLSKENNAAEIERSMMLWSMEVAKWCFRYCEICDSNVEVDQYGNCKSLMLHGGTYPYRVEEK